MFVRATIFEQKACDFLQEISVNKCDRDIHACYRLKEKDQAVAKFTNKKFSSNSQGKKTIKTS